MPVTQLFFVHHSAFPSGGGHSFLTRRWYAFFCKSHGYRLILCIQEWRTRPSAFFQ